MTSGERWLHQRIAAEIRAAIERGDYPPGASIPTMSELARQHDVSLMVIRQAVDLLRQEGVVQPRRGSGVYVRPAPPAPPAGRVLWRPERVPLGAGSRQVVRDVREMEPPLEIRDRLQLGDDRTVVRRCTVLLDSDVQAIADHFYPESVARQVPQLRDAGPTQDSGLDMLAEHGIEPADGDEEVIVRPATAMESEVLGLSTVAQVTRTVYDRAGRPVETMLAAVNPAVVAFRWRIAVA